MKFNFVYPNQAAKHFLDNARLSYACIKNKSLGQILSQCNVWGRIKKNWGTKMEKIHGTKKKGITGQIHNESLLPFSFFSVN
jgi:hypothetical protein